VILSPEWRRDRRDLRIAVLVGALLALSMLSHGSSIFGVIPLVIFAAFRGVPNWRWLGAAVASLLLIYVPWTAYQHWEDPPGNRLLKWQLGGETEINSEGTLEAIENGYSKEGLEGTIDLKEENFGEMVGWPRSKTEFVEAKRFLEYDLPGLSMEKVRWDRFFSLFPFLGILLLGPIAMIVAWLTKKKRDPDEWRFALLCFAFFTIACVTWGFLLFGTPDSRTTIHVGSLAVPLLGLVGCIVGMRSIYPRVGIALALVNVLFVLFLYAPSLTPPEGTGYSFLNAVLAALSLVGISYVIFREARPDVPLLARLSRPKVPALRQG
jgi:MFS family permease